MESEIIKENSLKPLKSFRIYSKSVFLTFLTYSRTDLTPVEALSQFQEKFSHISKYVISQEEHADEPEKGKHLHVYLEFNKKTNILSCKKLDLIDNLKKKILHGEYQAVKNKADVINYIKKDGNFITNFETNLEFELNLQKIALAKV